MKLINKTNWDTKDLKKIINLVFNKVAPERKKHTSITISTSKNYHGRASIGGYWIEMRVPPTTITNLTSVAMEDGTTKIIREQLPREFNVKGFGQILEHEIRHNLGLRNHRDMVDWWKLDVSHLDGLDMNPKKSKPKQQRNLVAERYQKAEKKVKELTTKAKRTQTILKKWKKKVKYYQNKIAQKEKVHV